MDTKKAKSKEKRAKTDACDRNNRLSWYVQCVVVILYKLLGILWILIWLAC